jgi:hypothetical protein
MKVIAKEEGFYGGSLIKPMTEFEFNGEKPGKWMVPVGSKESVVKPAENIEDNGPTRKEIMAQLEQAGVSFKPNMSKAELLDLLKSVIEKYAPGSSTADKDIAERTEGVMQ